MEFNPIVTRVSRYVANHSPEILTAMGVTGVITTAYLTGKASFKAAEILQAERHFQKENGEPLETKQKVLRVWKLYIPAASTATVTIASIVCASRINSRRAAAMAAAFSITEKAFEEYRGKIVEKMGTNKERLARDEIAQERLDRDPVTSREVIITGNGDVLCYDAYSGRYFESNMDKLLEARNAVNFTILNEGSASVGDFYDMIGLPRTSHCDEVGWNTDRQMELEITPGMATNKKPCLNFTFMVTPIRGYYRGR